MFEKIMDHPFLRGLVEGNLREESFKFYVMQDSLYLSDFASGFTSRWGES